MSCSVGETFKNRERLRNGMGSRLWVWVLFLLLGSSLAVALVKEDRFDFILLKEGVRVSRETVFSEPISRRIDLGLPLDAQDIEVWLNDEFVAYRNPLGFENVSKVRVAYTTRDFLDKNDFFVNMKAQEVLEYLRVTLTLAEGFELKLAAQDGFSGSVYPRPSAMTSDGQRIKIIWERQNFRPEDEFSILVVFKEKSNAWVGWGGVALLLVATGIAFLYKKSRKEAGKVFEAEPVAEVEEKKEEKPKEGLDISEHLKEDERQVISILNKKEGVCEQGTIRFLGNFSKAKLSRILSELEDRNIIYKEIKGKKNIIHLKKGY